MTAPYLDAACTDLVNKGQPLKGTFKVKNYVTDKKVSVVPFAAEDSACRLGEGFILDGYYGVARCFFVGRRFTRRMPQSLHPNTQRETIVLNTGYTYGTAILRIT